MPETYKVLGQVITAAAATWYTAYAPASQAIASTITLCNIGATTIKVSMVVRVAGAALAVKQYLLWDVKIDPGTTEPLTWGVTLGPTDLLDVYSDLGNLAVSVFGTEIT